MPTTRKKTATTRKPTTRKKKTAEVAVGGSGPETLFDVADGAWRVDSKTGEICIGNECVEARISKDGSFVLDVDPNAKTCSPEVKERLTRSLLNAAEGKGRVKFRRRAPAPKA